MNEVGKALREGFAAALDGNLSYASTNVPVFDQKVEGSPLMYVRLGRMSDDNKTNKTRFVTEKLFEVEAYNIRHATAQSAVTDSIADQILAIIIPTPNTPGFSVAGYNVTFCRLENSSNEEPVDRAGERIVHMKKTTFRIRIVQ